MHSPGSARLGLALVLLASALLAPPAEAVKELSDWESGILTHYGGAQDKMNASDPSFGTIEGACGYGAVPKDRWPYFSVAALSPQNVFFQQGPLDGCGQCFQIQCVSGMDGWEDACIKDSKGKPKSILVQITDKCPECGADHLDVQSLSFAKLMNPDLGRMKISYRRIECTPPDDMKVSVMDFVGSNGWLRIAIDDTGGRGAVESVEIRSSNTSGWIVMSNTWGATWELPKSPKPPLDFKISTDDGEEVLAEGVIKQNGGISQGAFAPRVRFQTNVQFTITDPAATTVQANSGPSEDFDPMVATSDTLGNSYAPFVEAPASTYYTRNGVIYKLPPGRTAPGASPSPAAQPVAPQPAPATEGMAETGECTDVPAPGQYTCPELRWLGKCKDSAFVKAGYCAISCGRCSPRTAMALGPAAEPSGGAMEVAALEAGAPASEAAAPSTAADPACSNTPPPGGYTCAQQKAWGKCDAPYMLPYCAETCGRCAPAAATKPTKGPATEPEPAAAANASGAPASEPARARTPLPEPFTEPLADPRPSPASEEPDTTAAAAAAAAAEDCVDKLPTTSDFTCAQQKAWGKCGASYLAGLCDATCGRCTAAPASAKHSQPAPTPEGPKAPAAEPKPAAAAPAPRAEAALPQQAAAAPLPEGSAVAPQAAKPAAPAAEPKPSGPATPVAKPSGPATPVAKPSGPATPVAKPAAASPAAGGDCKDVPIPGGSTCQQQKDWGKCDKDYMAGFCDLTCGRCGAAGSTPGPAVQAFGGGPSRGRRLLRSRAASV